MNASRRWPGRLAVAVLAALAYLPALGSSRGVMPADTKLYLYLDPGRLIGDAPYTFDGRQFAGWVPHQMIAYLWPQGPWYWLGDRIGLPDWVVHRLWIGTLMVLAGAGVLWCARRLGFGLAAALAAALVYQLSPYLLPYVSRTSAMLLPWAGLGWIVGLTVLAARRGGWRYPALLALVVASVGAVNATALLMIVPAPALWLLVAVLDGTIGWRRALATSARIGVLCLAASAWWVGAVVVQGRYGAAVLSYSETLRAVSRTSTSAEVWRGMGYWLAYLTDHVSSSTTAALAYATDRPLMLVSYLVPIAGVAGLTTTRFGARRYAIVLVAVGLVLAVGVHPIDDPTPLMRLILSDEESGAALALRSSTRAIPVLLLGLGFGVAALVDATGAARGRSWRPWAATAAVLMVALAAMPALRHGQLVDPSLSRQHDVPAAWHEAAAALDEMPAGYRVMQLPGLEFGAFRWGVTVDPPLPGLTDRPVVTRDLLPLGSGPAMDLLWALDNRFQDGVAEHAAVAPVARLFGADQIWLMGDAAYERYRTPRPELTSAFFAVPGDGLGLPIAYGDPVANTAAVPTVDETSVSDRRVGAPVAPVELVPVEDPVAVIRAKDEVVLVAGSGDGLVDAAAAGLLDGTELVRYTGSLADDDTTLDGASRLIVTDSARDRTQNWAGSQDTTGFTESSEVPGRDLLDPIGDDVRLDVFGPDAAATLTDAVQDGPVTARATGYGDPFGLEPEDRPVMAIDGDVDTAWRVAERFDATNARIELSTSGQVDHVTLRQPDGAAAVRHISRVRLAVFEDYSMTFDEVVELDERSLRGDGQRIDIPASAGAVLVSITIVDVAVPDPTIGPALAAVGFAEIDLGLGPTTEVVRVGNDLADVAVPDELATSYVFTRLRTDPLDRWRSDPEPEIVREWEHLVATDDAALTATVRLDRRAGDEVLAAALGIDGPTSSAHASGAIGAAGWAAADGDPSTAWITGFAAATASALTFTIDAPTTRLHLTQPDGALSPITSVRVQGGPIDVTAPVVRGADNIGVVDLGGELPAGPVTVTIAAIEPRETLDRRYGEPVELPAAIGEIREATGTAIPARVDTGCRDDLLSIDDTPVPIRITGSVTDLLAGDAVTATPCGVTTLAPGAHRLTSSASGSGWTIDRVVLGTPAPTTAATTSAAAGPVATVTEQGRLDRTVAVSGCAAGCWLVLGEGWHPQWRAGTADGSLGPPELVDGGFNGWWIEPSDGEVVVTIQWGAQRPLNLALAVSVVGLLACLGLVGVGWWRGRTRPALDPALPAAPARWAFPGPALAGAPRRHTVLVWAVAATVLVGPTGGLAALAAGGVLIGVLGRPRLVGLLGAGLLAAIVAGFNWVLLHDPPAFPYDVPERLEHLHRLGLFAAVALVAMAVGRDDGEPS
ncbi:MAG: alpha-(1-_3)-arabinofuranosyltransferase family protein [Desertimonas sp.]